MSAHRFISLNQYNWLGQKFLAQHRYGDLLRLRQHLKSLQDHNEQELAVLSERPLSDHFNYISGLALMKTSAHLKELILILQKLNFQKDGQYFLLLCQSLAYLGNHDSVVALCKQVLNKEIDAVPSVGDIHQNDGKSTKSICQDAEKNSKNSITTKHQLWEMQQICEESIEFKQMFESVNKNSLINDSRLWFLFALSLEFQLKFKDADLAHRVACKLASGQARQILAQGHHSKSGTSTIFEDDDRNSSHQVSSFGISNYYSPHTNYGEFCIRYREDYRTTSQILSQAIQISPPINYTVNPALALTLCSQANSNSGHFARALEMINSLDNHSTSLRNPSLVYNQLALKCKQKLYYHDLAQSYMRQGNADYLDKICDENRLDLGYALIKSHIVVNAIVQQSLDDANLYKSSVKIQKSSRSELDPLFEQLDKIIDTLRSCDTSCWSSHSLWNNLGVCYLIKRRYIASLSCLVKAYQLNPVDWRINYNLSLVCLQVGLTVRALCCSLASRSYHVTHQSPNSIRLERKNTLIKSHDPILNTLIAISYSNLGLNHEARRFYAEVVASGRSTGSNKIPALTLINYLLLLHQDNTNIELSEEQIDKSIARLLDLLEQVWLQRNPNDNQFAMVILDLARQIGDARLGSKPQMKKTYAWTKFDQS